MNSWEESTGFNHIFPDAEVEVIGVPLSVVTQVRLLFNWKGSEAKKKGIASLSLNLVLVFTAQGWSPGKL